MLLIGTIERSSAALIDLFDVAISLLEYLSCYIEANVPKPVEFFEKLVGSSVPSNTPNLLIDGDRA